MLRNLTPAEERVVALLVHDGQSDVEIAAHLGISSRTVEQHLRSAYRKAAAHWNMENVNRAGLVVLLGYYYLLNNPTGKQDTGFSG